MDCLKIRVGRIQTTDLVGHVSIPNRYLYWLQKQLAYFLPTLPNNIRISCKGYDILNLILLQSALL